MLYEFEPPRLEERYCDERYLKKKYGVDIAQGMMKFLGVLLAAENAYDIKSKPQFFMEHKKGNLSLYYSVSLDKKRSKWRLLVQMLDEDGNVVIPTEDEKAFLQSIKKIRIKEISDHYAGY